MDAAEQIKRFEDFFEGYKTTILSQINRNLNFLLIDFAELSRFDPELAQDILSSPEDAIRAAELAIKEMESVQHFRVRLRNLPDSQKIMIRNIRSSHIGQLLVIEGIVRQKSDVRPQVVSSKFECPSCGNIISVLQVESSLKEPTRCGCGRKGKFTLISKELVDAQGLVLEESPENLEGGEQPKRISVFLKEDLVSPITEKRTNPGSKIIVIGQVKEVPIVLRSGSRSTRFDLLIEANNVEAVEETFYEVEITREEEKRIRELAQDPRIYEKLVNSIAPSIYGYEKIKEALLLQLMGGVQKKRTDGVVSRGDMHLLLVGDPGSGKSQLLKRISAIAPKGRYVSGKGVSGAGVTAAVVRDEFLGGWSLEAGALVLASNGVCCIDELDKMSSEDRGAMHEAMEQQSYHPESEILLSDGSVKKIGCFVDELMERNNEKVIIGKDCEILPVEDIEVLSTNFNKIFPVKVARVSRHYAPEYFIKLTYSHGRKILVTPEHPVYVYRNNRVKEVLAEHVKKNDLALAPRRLRCRKEKINPLLARLLGYVVTEGCIYRNLKTGCAEIRIDNADKKIIKECKHLLETVFNSKTNINIQSKEKRKSATNVYTVRCSSVPLYELFLKNFPEVVNNALKKRVPNKIKQADLFAQTEFLKAAFKGDGFVDSKRFGYSAASYDLAKDYQDLLLMQGIWSCIAEEKRDYKVVVSSTNSLAEFNERIVEAGDERKKKISYLCARSKRKANYRASVPAEIVKQVDSLLRELRLGAGYFNKTIEKNQNSQRAIILKYLYRIKNKVAVCERIVCGTTPKEVRKAACISVSRLARSAGICKSMLYYLEKNKKSRGYKKLLSAAKATAFEKLERINKELDSLLKLVEGELRFVTVKNIRKIKNKDKKWVYDVTVEPTKTFISEGLVLHNTISISKANIQATLLARTTVLAAANPKFGRFDPYGVIAEQIDLPPTLINRFDLIFPIKDLPNEANDEKMAKHILNLHQIPDVGEEDIPTRLLKKYFAYARQKVVPVLTDSALNEIKDFYVQMRNRASVDERAVKSIPISPRQLEALVRLSEASAKIRLSDKVTKRDARRAIELLTYCLLQVGVDRETGRIDIDRIATGISASQRDKIFHVKDVIAELENKLGKTVPIDDIIKLASGRGLTESEVEEIIERLKRLGDVYEPRHGFLQRL
jgi:replicative DNA helicase Mcm